MVDAIIHEQYFPAALFNDVALLFLAEPVDLGPEADVVCLPRPDQVFDGSRCFCKLCFASYFVGDNLYSS